MKTIYKALYAILLTSIPSWAMDTYLSLEEQGLARLDAFERLFAKTYPYEEEKEDSRYPSPSKDNSKKIDDLFAIAYPSEPGRLFFNFENDQIHWLNFIESAKIYHKSLKEKKIITSLSLWGGPLRDIHDLLTVITVNELTIGCLPWANNATPQRWASLFSEIAKQKTLHSLDINGWCFSESDFTAFAQFVIDHPHLETLSFKNIRVSASSSQLPHERWNFIGNALTRAKKLRHLDLRWCQLNDAVIYLFSQERKISTLETLNISYNNISGKAFSFLVPLINKNLPNLAQLDISGNPLLRTSDPVEEIFIGYESLNWLFKKCKTLYNINIADTIHSQFPSLAFVQAECYAPVRLKEFSACLLQHFQDLRDKLGISSATFHAKDLSSKREMLEDALYGRISTILSSALSQVKYPPFFITMTQLTGSYAQGAINGYNDKKIICTTLDSSLPIDFEDVLPLNPIQSYEIKWERSNEEDKILSHPLKQEVLPSSSSLSHLTWRIDGLTRDVSRSTSRSVEALCNSCKTIFSVQEASITLPLLCFNNDILEDARLFAQGIEQSRAYKKHLHVKKNGSFALRNFPYSHVKKLLHNNNMIQLELSGLSEERKLENGRTIIQSSEKASDQYIIQVCEDLRYHPDLRTLKVCGMNLFDAGFRAIGMLLSQIYNLKYLDLSHSTWLGTSPAFRDFLKGLKENKSIETLILSDCALYGAFYTGSAENKKESLRNGIVKDNQSLFVSIIAKHKALKNLNISYNCLNYHSLSPVLSALQKGQHMESLDLSNNSLFDNEAQEDSLSLFKELCTAITKQKKLIYLNLSNTISSDQTLKKTNHEKGNIHSFTISQQIGMILTKLTLLSDFSYQQNGLDDSCIHLILEAIETKTSSLSIDLSHNALTNKAAVTFREYGKKFKTDHNLSLTGNPMSLTILTDLTYSIGHIQSLKDEPCFLKFIL